MPDTPINRQQIVAEVARLCDRPAVDRFVVALSGGLDSAVLTHVLAEPLGERLRAVHVNHGLQHVAHGFADTAQSLCASLGVAFRSVDLHLDVVNNVEARARAARYAALADALAEGEYLLTAQHQDDQLETVLLQLLRGAGPAGLAAMAERARFAAGWHLRPLLGFRRAQIAAYAADHDVPFCDDPSNQDERFERNYLRHQVIAPLRRRWPSAAATVSRSARLAAQADALLGDLAALDAGGALCVNPLPLHNIGTLDTRRLANLIRGWLKGHGRALPNERRLSEFVRQLKDAGDDRHPQLVYADVCVEMYRERLYDRSGQVPAPGDWDATLRPDSGLVLPAGLGRLTLTGAAHNAGPQQGLRVAFRRGGERLAAAAGAPRLSLKNFFNQRAVLPWMRSRVPLLFAGDTLVAIGDLWQAPDGSFAQSGAGWAIVWHDRPPLVAE